VTAAYGFDIGADLYRRLRGRPPRRALRWVEAQLGARVLDAQALEGGTSSAVHRLSVQMPSGRLSDVVLRRYVLDWVVEEREVPGHEAFILRSLAGIDGIPSPRVLAADPSGDAAGVPAIVMSALPGAVVWHPTDRELWLRSLADLLPIIHAVPLWPELREWEIYEPQPDLVPPPWTKHPRAWELALELYEGRQPPSDRVFVHRDFHPGNVLWTGVEVTGIVDWVSSCAGPTEQDVAHCRVNIAQHHGVEAADRFLALWQQVSGRPSYDPYWDLMDVVSMVSEQPDPALDAFVAAAAARIR
jgi:aminoglycoside phosphotransferase (APT) family kinase protein